MKKFKLVLELENDAMQDTRELSRIVGQVAKRFRHGQELGSTVYCGLFDINGNEVGYWSVISDED